MSTYFYLECFDHPTPLRNPRESGQHHFNLPAIVDMIARRHEIADRFAADGHTLDGDESVHWLAEKMYAYGFKDPRCDGDTHVRFDPADISYFAGQSAAFLVAHCDCNLGLVDEYNLHYNPLTGEALDPADEPIGTREAHANHVATALPAATTYDTLPAGTTVQFREPHAFAGAFGVVERRERSAERDLIFISCPIIARTGTDAVLDDNSADDTAQATKNVTTIFVEVTADLLTPIGPSVSMDS